MQQFNVAEAKTRFSQLIRKALAGERFVVEHCETNSFRLLPITLAHIASVQDLPLHHRDPFDRLVVAQARHEEMTRVSRDLSLKACGVSVIRFRPSPSHSSPYSLSFRQRVVRPMPSASAAREWFQPQRSSVCKICAFSTSARFC
jgi:antitoxin (DNA-binding transcriptional repressor) of toxin-antitoxin stability system